MPTATTVTEQIMKLAEQAGLRPIWRGRYGGIREILLNAPGEAGVFGVIEVGARSGKVLRATLHYGNGGRTQKLTGAVEVRAVLKELAEEATDD
jgi:hypothetical protein